MIQSGVTQPVSILNQRCEFRMEQFEQINHESEGLKKEKRKGILSLLIFLIITIIVTALITSAVTWFAAKRKYQSGDDHFVTSVKQAREIIREHFFYYNEDEKELTELVLKGVASATGDRYAEYYTESEYEDLKKQNKRNYVGIGILTQLNESGYVEILDVYEDTPAAEAGVRPGDLIVEINGIAYNGETLSDFLANVHAEDGAENHFVIRRGDETLPFTIVAREVHTPAISYRMLTDTIGYIHVQTFHGTCVEETKTAIDELRKSGMQKLVLDLRDNLGGSLYDAIDIADIFLPKNHVVTSLRSRDGKVEEYKTKNAGLDMQMILLVNNMSASASELVAGALKDYEAAYLIGTQTYGKGIVQTFYEVTETKGWLKLTTEAYYTPNGICVQDEGITPNQIVELPEEAKRYSIDLIPFELDTQLQAAIAYLED